MLVGGAALAAVAALLALRPELADRLPRQLVWVAAALGALALVSSGAAPTGWVVLDAGVRALAGACAVLSVARLASPWSIWLAVVTSAGLVVGDAGGWEHLAAAGIGVALAGAVSGGGSAALRALAAAAMVGSLGHLDWPVMTGASVLLALVALLPVLLAGLGVAPNRVRSAAPVVFAGVLLLCLGGAVAGGLAALQARVEVDRAVDAAIAGLDGADADDPGPAIEKLDEAAASFEAARSTLGSWWARPALLVPVVAQHTRAVSTMADSGADLARAAARSLDEVDLDTLHPVDGRVDPARLRAVEPALDRALSSLRRADERLTDVRSPLLVELVADRLDDLAVQVSDAREAAETASAALDVAPGLLGADEPRRYFLVMQTPSELRGVGGFMGSWGELVIDGGHFELTRTGRVTELTRGGPDPAGRRIVDHPEFVDHWTQAPAQFWGLIGFSPDFPTVGAIIAQLYPQSGGVDIDGVIGLDPAGFAALLELTGPISVEGFEGELTPENAEEILLHGQYLDEAEEDREAFLEAAIRRLFDELTAGELPGPETISAALAPMVDGRHVQLFSTHREEQRFFASIGADGSVRRTRDAGIGVVGQNYNGNKIDYFLRRSLAYDVTWDPASGLYEGTVEVRLENLAPASGLPHSVIGWGGDLVANQLPVADGENLMYLSLFSSAEVTELTVDGAPAEQNRIVEDLGYVAHDLYVRVPSGEARVLRASIRGQVRPGERFAVEALRQPTATPDQLSFRVRLADGWRWVATGGARTEGPVAAVTGDASAPFAFVGRAEPSNQSLLDRLRGQG